jgi:hypothetical protein
VDEPRREALDVEPATRSLDTASPSWLRWWVLIATFAFAGVAWSLATPPMGAPDEPAYAVRATALWTGQVDARPTAVGSKPYKLGWGDFGWFRLPAVWNAGYAAPCFAFQPNKSASCQNFTGSTQITDVPNGFPYNIQPAWLILTGWVGRLFPGVVGLYGMRLVSALVGAVLLAAAVRALAETIPPRLAVLGVLAAITPTAWFIIGSANPNGLEITAAVSTWAHALAIGRRRTTPTHLLVGLVLSAGLLAFTRPLSPIWVVIILGVAAVMAGYQKLRALWIDRRSRLAGSIIVAAVLIAAVIAKVTNTTVYVSGGDVNAATLGPEFLGRDLVQTVAEFGWIDTPVPPAALLWLIALVPLVVAAFVFGRNRARAGLALSLAVTMVVLMLNTIPGLSGGGWQGRYGLPLTVGTSLCAVVALGDRWPRPASQMRWVMPVVVAAVGLANLVAFYWALQRFTIGLPLNLNANVFDGAWRPVGGAVLPITLMLVFLVLSTMVVVGAPAALDIIEPADSEPADIEPADSEPVDSEPVDSEPVDTEPDVLADLR